jgi:hypothetical protein
MKVAYQTSVGGESRIQVLDTIYSLEEAQRQAEGANHAEIRASRGRPVTSAYFAVPDDYAPTPVHSSCVLLPSDPMRKGASGKPGESSPS